MIRARFVPTLILLALAAPLQAADHAAVLDWSGRVSLTLSVSGVLDQVPARAGQVVKKGELLASLEPTLFKAAVAENRADLDRLTEEHADAKRDLERVQELYNRTVSATTELDAAKLRFARAQAGLAATQARLERARRLLAESELRAPFDAVVLARHGEPGLVITSQCQPAAVFSVARADELIARAQVDGNQAAGVKLGGDTEILAAGKTMKGRVTGLVAQTEGRYAIEVAVPRREGLMAGQPATIRLP